jgi:hypothetical protein
MMSEPQVDYSSMSTDEILDNLRIQIYKPPLSKLREDPRSVPEVLRIPVLIIAFDTEVCMKGILGFLENSTGFLPRRHDRRDGGHWRARHGCDLAHHPTHHGGARRDA